MPRVSGIECDLCGVFARDGFTVVVSSETARFDFGPVHDQDSIRLDICRGCLDKVPGVVKDALR